MQHPKAIISQEPGHLKEKLNKIIKDYLLQSNYLRALEGFETDLTQGEPKDQGALATLLQSFDQGQREQFFSDWNKYVPVADRDGETKKREFYLQLYFLIYQIHPNTPKVPKAQLPDYRKAMRHFKTYLDSAGIHLSKTTEVLNFYALAYIEEPQQNPAFQELFQQDWLLNIRIRLKTFLQNVVSEQSELKRLYLQPNRSGQYIELQESIKNLNGLNREIQNEKNRLKQQIRAQQTIIQKQQESASNLWLQGQEWFSKAKKLAEISMDFRQMINQNLNNREPFDIQKLQSLNNELSIYEIFFHRSEQQMEQAFDTSMVDSFFSTNLEYNPDLIQQNFESF